MSGFKIPADAELDWICPNGRIMTPAIVKCIGPKCAAWRWRALPANTPAFLSAIKKRMKDAKQPHPDAVKYVIANRAEFGLPTEPFEGWCGLAGKPEA